MTDEDERLVTERRIPLKTSVFDAEERLLQRKDQTTEPAKYVAPLFEGFPEKERSRNGFRICRCLEKQKCKNSHVMPNCAQETTMKLSIHAEQNIFTAEK